MEHLEEATSRGSWCDQETTQGATGQWPTWKPEDPDGLSKTAGGALSIWLKSVFGANLLGALKDCLRPDSLTRWEQWQASALAVKVMGQVDP